MTSVPSPSGVRVNRYLAGRGVASRRGADRLVEEGRVAVNGQRAAVGALVDPRADTVTVDGRALPPAPPLRTLMLNKPAGVVSTRRDPQGRPTVIDLVEAPGNLVPVGRLDTDSRGLLLLTNDGALALRLTHPRYGVIKRYRVTVRGRATERVLRALRGGVELEDGFAQALEARPVAHAAAGDVIEVAMAEGRRREVRRLCEAVGIPVVDLERIALGPVHLGRLYLGGTRRLHAAEERRLYEAVGLDAPGAARSPR